MWQVIDSQTNKVMGRYEDRSAAQREALRLGGIRHIVRFEHQHTWLSATEEDAVERCTVCGAER